MKSLFTITIILAAMAISTAAQCSDADKKALEAFDRAWGAAGQNGDRAALMAIYADDYVGMPDMNGKASTIDDTMKTFERNKANPAGANKVTHDHYIISCTPNSALITHRNAVWTPNGTGGKPETFYTRSVHNLEKRGGKWVVVSNAGNGLDDYDVIWYLEQDWNDAVLKQDKAWFEKNYADDFSSISGSTATLMNKAQDIADTVDPKTKFDTVATTNMNIRIDGDKAIVTGVFHTKGTGADGPFDRKVRYTDVWIKRDGRWVAWASQGTPMK